MMEKLKRKSDSEEEEKDKMNSLGPLLGSGTQLAVTMIIFILIGKYIDDKNGTLPTYTFIFAVIDIIIGLYSFIKTVITYTKNSSKK